MRKDLIGFHSGVKSKIEEIYFEVYHMERSFPVRPCFSKKNGPNQDVTLKDTLRPAEHDNLKNACFLYKKHGSSI